MSQRLSKLQQMTEELFSELSLSNDDFLVCEGPAQLVLNPQSSLKVERVRSLFESIARTRGVIVPGRLNPRTVQTEILGMRGAQLKRDEVKRWARATVERLFGKELKKAEVSVDGTEGQIVSQDCIDAILIGVLASSRIVNARKTGSDPMSAFVEKTASGNRRNGYGAPRFAAIPSSKRKMS